MENNLERRLSQRWKRDLPPPLWNTLSGLGRVGEKLGLRTFLVGGFVRDLLLHRKNLDADIAVEGKGGAVRLAREFSRKGKTRIRVFPRFGTATLYLPDEYRIDLATTRRETYPHPAALPRVRPGRLEEDLYRRDFTINSLALCLSPSEFGKLIDPFGGGPDLKSRKLRVLHPQSFQDDPTRIFRALRFEQRLGFRITPDNLRLIEKTLAEDIISRLSGTRLTTEIKHSLSLPAVVPLLSRMEKLGVLAGIHPSLKFDLELSRVMSRLQSGLKWFRDKNLTERFPGFEPWVANLAALTAGLENNDWESLRKRLGLSPRVSGKVDGARRPGPGILTRLEDRRTANHRVFRLLERIPPEAVLFLEAQSGKEPARKAARLFLSRLSFRKTEINGNDLKKLGIPPGPVFKEILGRLLDLRVDGEIRSRKQELEWVKKHYAGIRILP